MRINEDFLDDVKTEEVIDSLKENSTYINREWDFQLDCIFSEPVTQGYKKDIVTKDARNIERFMDNAPFCTDYRVVFVNRNDSNDEHDDYRYDDYHQGDNLRIQFDGKFHTVRQLFRLMYCLAHNDIRQMYVTQKGYDYMPFFDKLGMAYKILHNHPNSYKAKLNDWEQMRMQLCGLILFMMPGNVRAIEQFFDIVCDSNEQTAMQDVIKHVLEWDYFLVNDEHIPLDVRRSLRQSRMNLLDCDYLYMIYDSVDGTEEQKFADGEDELTLKTCFLDAHLHTIKMGVDLEEGIAALYSHIGLAHWRTDENYPYIDDVIVCCTGDIKTDEFKQRLQKFLPDTPEKDIDVVISMLKKQWDERYKYIA